jgi:hypothetical protein
LGLECRLASSFLQTPPFRQKTYAIFFPRFTEAAAETKILSYSGRGHILLLRGYRRGEIEAIVITDSSLA